MPRTAALFPSLDAVRSAVGQVSGNVVLLVEDEDSLAELLAHLLKRLQIQVVRAASGATGLRLFEENRARIALAFVDCHLPDMDGRQLCGELRQREPHLPLLLTSGRDQRAVAASFAAGGPAGFLAKPYMPAEVLGRVSALIAGSPQR